MIDLKKNTLLVNCLKLILGSGGAKLIGILAMPVLARIYSPEQFGLFTTFTSLVLVLAPLISLRYCDAIPLPASNRQAILLVFLCGSLIGAFVLCVTLTFVVIINVISTPFSEHPFIFTLTLFSALLLSAMYEVLNMWAIRTKSFGVIAKSQVAQSFIGTITKLVMGGVSVGSGLMIGYIAQLSSGNYRLFLNFYLYFKKIKIIINPNKLINIARRYSRYPKLRLPSNLLMTLSQQLLVFYVALNFSQDNVGQLGLALSLIAIPTMLFVSTIKKVFYGEIVNNKSVKDILSLTYKFSIRLFVVALIPCLGLSLFGKEIFTYFFGVDWRLAGEVVECLSLYLVFSITVGPLLNVFDVLNKQKMYLIVNFIRFICLVLFCLISYVFEFVFIEIVFAYSVIMSLFFLGIYTLIIYTLKKERIS
ncbi:oligosaccharide flippase family protein [Pseudoalteromonas sp. AS84]|uniref:lipopolysaccharide biosynthesis protein n=1 Tax=Pseudoalteromonas sp. AS84 TaxID=3135778 RepID=UPI00317D40FB